MKKKGGGMAGVWWGSKFPITELIKKGGDTQKVSGRLNFLWQTNWNENVETLTDKSEQREQILKGKLNQS